MAPMLLPPPPHPSSKPAPSTPAGSASSGPAPPPPPRAPWSIGCSATSGPATTGPSSTPLTSPPAPPPPSPSPSTSSTPAFLAPTPASSRSCSAPSASSTFASTPSVFPSSSSAATPPTPSPPSSATSPPLPSSPTSPPSTLSARPLPTFATASARRSPSIRSTPTTSSQSGPPPINWNTAPRLSAPRSIASSPSTSSSSPSSRRLPSLGRPTIRRRSTGEGLSPKSSGEVPEIEWCEPGEDAAMEVLMGSKDGFLTRRLKNYETDRNDPLKPKGLSGLSPYLHFGQISAQRCALEAQAWRKSCPKSVDAFLEELIVRRELADNFCYYQPLYDSLQGAWEWARRTLMDHSADEREHLYTKEQLEQARTADPLWNASQLEMVHYGKMHGFMRMYWAKKILEWTSRPEEALSIAIYLNDKYEIDGRDPNGYVGCMWSICGVHDQGWKERPVFGKIRYMNYAGCKRKFNVDGYIAYVKRLVAKPRKGNQKAHQV
ncbi:deoxyribodipyrimidine photo-lyase isoform X1 [Elaeis guineensis]|uniref:deoxyribodipyrimidine photo-lyase isoform X1 n=1 Tax=Elaeis guineensis var. tenera TaxID=51953 RepID=UPI003C6D86D7